MRFTIFDLEADGLLDTITKTHCLSYRIYESKTLISSDTLVGYKEIAQFIENQEVLVGHNIVQYDVPALEKILDIEVKAKLIDTLAISFYLYPVSKFKHGLKYWGERLGFGKPEIEDWENQPVEVYIHRCESDVEINTRLFHYQVDYCMNLYGNLDKVQRLFGYLTYKLDCLREQSEGGIPLDARLAEESKLNLEMEIEEKISGLSSNMPTELGKILRNKPLKPYKNDGSLSSYGESWFNQLQDIGLPDDTLVVREAPNPASPTQLKDWLFQLGWIPETFKANAKGVEIPQVSLPQGQGLCPSVISMIDTYPFLEELHGLYKSRHRFGIFKSYLENVDSEGKVYAEAQGFTNTLRLQHRKPIANLPKVGIYYGQEIRGCLTIPDETYVMCGSDISGLEDNTKQHYIYIYDPNYVNQMRVPGFDAHIDIAVLSGLLTRDDELFFRWYNRQEDSFVFIKEYKDKMKAVKVVRGQAKVVNFSATYGAGPPKIANTLGCTLEFATKLHKTYWDRNKAVKTTAKKAKCKTVECKHWIPIKDKKLKEIIVRQKWLYNPVSGFWMFLKNDKDKFSTLNQSTGVYVFDSWVRKVREALKPLNIKIALQYHDEILLFCKKEYKELVELILKQAMVDTNKEIQLNVDIGISVDWGNNYADCH